VDSTAGERLLHSTHDFLFAFSLLLFSIWCSTLCFNGSVSLVDMISFPVCCYLMRSRGCILSFSLCKRTGRSGPVRRAGAPLAYCDGLRFLTFFFFLMSPRLSPSKGFFAFCGHTCMSSGSPFIFGGCCIPSYPFLFFAFGSSFDHLQRLEDRDGSMD